MNHINVDDVIEFVSIDKLDNDTIALAQKVNSHLLICPECRERVTAFQTVYDALLKIEKTKNAKQVLRNVIDGSIDINEIKKNEIVDLTSNIDIKKEYDR